MKRALPLNGQSNNIENGSGHEGVENEQFQMAVVKCVPVAAGHFLSQTDPQGNGR
jgi:hypothetical protein